MISFLFPSRAAWSGSRSASRHSHRQADSKPNNSETGNQDLDNIGIVHNFKVSYESFLTNSPYRKTFRVSSSPGMTSAKNEEPEDILASRVQYTLFLWSN